jgi:hypothetical protein
MRNPDSNVCVCSLQMICVQLAHDGLLCGPLEVLGFLSSHHAIKEAGTYLVLTERQFFSLCILLCYCTVHSGLQYIHKLCTAKRTAKDDDLRASAGSRFACQRTSCQYQHQSATQTGFVSLRCNSVNFFRFVFGCFINYSESHKGL